MANAEWKDDGRRCHACEGTRWLIQYRMVDQDGNEFITNMHPTCVGSWLMQHPGWRMEFEEGAIHEIR